MLTAMAFIKRLRFSLRTLLLITAAFAGFCYYWAIMPGTTAQRFIRLISCENFEAADQMFWKSVDRQLVPWQKKCWGMRADAELSPWSIGQLLGGRRDLRLQVTYFYLDEHHDLEMQLAATSFGIDSASTWSGSRSAIVDQVQRVMESDIL
jgi:hypothetical protein